MAKNKYIFFFIFIVLTVLSSSLVFAEDTDNNYNVSVVSDNGLSDTNLDVNSYETVEKNNIEQITNENKNLSNDTKILKNSTESTTIEVNNYNELYAEFEKLNTETKDQEITLNTGTYTANQTIVWTNNNNITVTINGNGQTIDLNNNQLLQIEENSILNLKLTDITIQNGQAELGGAISNNGILKLEGGIFKSNTATEQGGAIYNSGTLTVQGSTFTENTAKNYGGAISSKGDIVINDATFTFNTVTNTVRAVSYDHGGAAAVLYGKSYINNTRFENNTAVHNDVEPNGDGCLGGALQILYNNDDVTIANSTFLGNEARFGGAIEIYSQSNNGDKVITDCKFINNTALYGGALNIYNKVSINNSLFEGNKAVGQGSGGRSPVGGAICALFNNSDVTINNTNFTNNSALEDGLQARGGAIAVSDSAKMVVDNITIVNSTSYNGGAIAVAGGSNNNLTILNTKIINSTATNCGGAVLLNDNGILNVTNVEFVNSTADFGGVLFASEGSAADITKSKFTNNSAVSDGGVIYSLATLKLNESSFINNTVKKGYILTIENAEIADSTFLNNTNENDEDVLISSIESNTIDDNEYIDNNLETSINPVEDITIDDKDYEAEIEVILNKNENNIVKNGTVTVFINDNLYKEFTLTDGKAQITIENYKLNKETNNIILKYKALDSSYQESETTYTITTKTNIDSKLTITDDPISLKVGESKVLEATFTTNDGKALSGYEIVFVIGTNEDNYVTVLTDDNGKATYNYTASFAEKVGVKYLGSDRILSIDEQDYNLDITKNKLYLNLDSSITTLVGENTVLASNVVDENGTSIDNIVFNINIGDEYYTTISDNGINYIIDTTKLNAGNYVIDITSDNDKYESSEQSIDLTIAKHDVTLNINTEESIKPGNTLNVIVLVSENDNLVNEGSIIFKINGKTLKDDEGNNIQATIENGVATLKYEIPKNTAVKTYNITAVYGSTEYYNRSEDTTLFNVEKLNTYIKIDPITITKGTNTTIKAVIYDENNEIVSGDVNIAVKINGKTYTHSTVTDGIVEIIVPTDTIREGTYNLTLKTGDTKSYVGTNINTTLLVNKKDVSLKIISEDEFKTGDTLRVLVLVSEGNERVNEGTVIFKINGKTLKDNEGNNIQSNVTDGIATLIYNLSDMGVKTYNITAVYIDSTYYNRAEATSTFTIVKTNTHVQAEPVDVIEGSNATLKAVILDENNEPISRNMKVSIKIDGRTYIQTIVTDGLLNITIPTSNLNSNEYTVSIVVGENSRYNSSIGNTKLTFRDNN